MMIKEKINRSIGKIRNMIHEKAGKLNQDNKRVGNVSELMADEKSACHQIEYLVPETIIDWLKHGSKRFRAIFLKTKADSYNVGMVDQLIDNEVDIAIASINEQHFKHLSVVKEIAIAQRSRIRLLAERIANCKQEMEEILENHPDIPTTDIRHMTKKQKSQLPFYKRKWCLFVILGVSCVLDYTTISSSVDSLLTQNVFLSILLSVGTAMLINITPSIAGIYAKNKHAENRRIVLLMLAAIFIILFVILFGLRWATRDALFTDTSLLFASSVSANTNTIAQIFMTILLSAEPALTSAMSFVFGYIGATEEEKEHDMAELRFAELKLFICELQNRMNELQEVVERDQNAEDEESYYRSMIELMEQYRVHFKELARIELAQIVAKPEGNGIILQREKAILF